MSHSGGSKTPSASPPDHKAAVLGSPTSPLADPAPTSSSSRSLSGELPRPPHLSHRRSRSCTSAPSDAPPLPAGNICPSGRVTPATSRTPSRSDVLGSGTGNYGHGSIVRKHHPPPTPDGPRRSPGGEGPDDLRRAGNELYRRGRFGEALEIYGRAIRANPGDPACRSNRAAALAAMGRVVEAAAECEEAVRIDPAYGRAHQRLAGIYLRLGQVDNARKHLYSTGEQPDQTELQKLQTIEKHASRSMDARRIGDWKDALRESDAAIAAGADSSILLLALRAESLLRLHRLDEADSTLSKTINLETPAFMCPNTRFFGMLLNSYLYLVRARVEMALGRFEDAEASAKKALELDPENREVLMVMSNVRSVGSARAHGNELFNSGNFTDACEAYAEGLKFDPFNPVLYCNRAVCHSKLGLWDKSIADCNEALKIQPNYIKALLRRAASYAKLERWAESVRDYELLRKELPNDTDIAESLSLAQAAWKASQGLEGLNLKSRGEAEKVTKLAGEAEKVMNLERFQAAVSLPGISVVCFMARSNRQSTQSSLFVDLLRPRYPSLCFLKVDVDECSSIAMFENVRIVPTFKVYKNGTRLKEMICPSQQILEQSLRHYSSI